MNSAVRPQLCFGEVRHARLAPARNAFRYGVYFLRLPLRAMAASATRRMAGGLFGINCAGLLSYHDADHGDGKQPPLAWIEALLAGEGIADADGEIWLQTFPRVLGYVFNPVSFWFCERADGALRAIVCEVCNTFGEKHCYLLARPDGQPLAWGETLEAAKTFHVSPFCRVRGQYRFRFMQTADGQGAVRRVVARIDYLGDAGERQPDGERIDTSVSGQTAALTAPGVLRAFFAYPWMTLGVTLRIHWQALRLWRKRVPFFSKPAPPAQAVTRSVPR